MNNDSMHHVSSPASRFGHARAVLAGVVLAACALAQPAFAAPADTMIKAIKFDDVSEVKKQLAQGMDPNLVDNTGTPLLVIAAREKSDKVGQVLAGNPKTDLEKQDPAGENAMMLAALNGDATFVNLLIAKDAEVNKKGWTPLHYAATNGHDDIVKILLDHSAYIDAGSPNGTTPLMMAARGGHLSTVKLLLDEGADLRVKNQIGMTAVDFAQKYNEKDVAEGLAARLQSMQQGASAPQSGANSAK
ncbi:MULTISPECIES: ankyrin repeat domain-containing protein [unclassified Caballeronia]|uniref:ankyrin repeat domain-containing protein n=1 Tax=unclassified Caballeronia TaxID=2646786 RepID=UPI002865A0A3|nr:MULTISPECIES: ankyrin repeat domain-containing protein [unclassified Caballeronia]MDR5750656.1 ankyrin repeat domain-containing protein [Caballeronia sp. LZ024]MDR5842311.1 ankyrin repeat domain-containing protein [Caballeronia sp. LZ031]